MYAIDLNHAFSFGSHGIVHVRNRRGEYWGDYKLSHDNQTLVLHHAVFGNCPSVIFADWSIRRQMMHEDEMVVSHFGRTTVREIG